MIYLSALRGRPCNVKNPLARQRYRCPGSEAMAGGPEPSKSTEFLSLSKHTDLDPQKDCFYETQPC